MFEAICPKHPSTQDFSCSCQANLISFGLVILYVFYMLFQSKESCVYTKYIILLHVFSLLVLQNIPVAKAVDMVLAGEGEQSLGIILL